VRQMRTARRRDGRRGGSAHASCLPLRPASSTSAAEATSNICTNSAYARSHSRSISRLTWQRWARTPGESQSRNRFNSPSGLSIPIGQNCQIRISSTSSSCAPWPADELIEALAARGVIGLPISRSAGSRPRRLASSSPARKQTRGTTGGLCASACRVPALRP